jgi:PKD repeat protein
MGGRFSLTHVDGGTSRFDKHGIVYHAVCAGCRAANPTGGPTSDFPTTGGAWSNLNRSPNCNNAAFKFDLSSLIADLKGPTTDVCIQDTVEFANTSTGGELFFWDFGDDTKVVTTEPTTMKHAYQAAGSYTVRLKVVDEGTCKSVDSTKVNINVGEHVAVVQDDDAICEGVFYSLEATGGVSYVWTSSDGNFNSTEQSPFITPTETTEYYVIVQEPIGCVLKDTVRIEVVPKVDTDFSFSKSDFCFGKSNLHVLNTTEGAEDAQMIFYFGDGATSEEPEATHQYEKSDVYKVRLAAIREFCVFEKAIDIPLVNITIPNVITPEVSSGYNDSFMVQVDDRLDVGPFDFGVPVSLIILNRWGDKLFETNDYQNDWVAPDLASSVASSSVSPSS